MKRAGIAVSCFGIVMNFSLFLAKLYVALSSNSLSVYCDSINNLLDIVSCALALLCFYLILKLEELRADRAQSLCTFVISLVIALTGAYFIYNGISRTLYPAPVTYSYLYIGVLTATVAVKAFMAFVYHRVNRTLASPVVLDCGITVFSLMSLLLVRHIGFPADGVFAICLGTVITVTAVKAVIKETKFIVNGA